MNMTLVKPNLAQGKQSVRKAVFDRVIDWLSLADGLSRIILTHFFCLQISIDEVEFGKA